MYSILAKLYIRERLQMSDEYLSKEEIKKWRSSVEKITLEEYAARLGKKIQETKQTNDLADMLYTHFNPAQTPKDYDVVTKLEKIDLTPKAPSSKNKKSSKISDEFEDDFEVEEDMIFDDINDFEEKPSKKEPKIEKKSEAKPKVKEKEKEKAKAKEVPAKEASKAEKENTSKKTAAKEKKAPASKEKKAMATSKTNSKNNFPDLGVTFKKPLTDREERVLAHFIEKRGEIVYAKDLAELLDLKRDYIYKYIKNLRAKMSTDLIVNADNGGFKLE